MLFVITVFDIIVQSLVKLQIIKNAWYWYQYNISLLMSCPKTSNLPYL